MSKTKFTKGEWVVFGDWGIKRKGTTEILASFEERGFNNKEGFANANLIAAAPEMYNELEKEIEFLTCLIENFPANSVETHECCVRIEEMKSKLTKARGELWKYVI